MFLFIFVFCLSHDNNKQRNTTNIIIYRYLTSNARILYDDALPLPLSSRHIGSGNRRTVLLRVERVNVPPTVNRCMRGEQQKISFHATSKQTIIEITCHSLHSPRHFWWRARFVELMFPWEKKATVYCTMKTNFWYGSCILWCFYLERRAIKGWGSYICRWR